MHHAITALVVERAIHAAHLCEGLSAILARLGREDLVCMVEMIRKDAELANRVLCGHRDEEKSKRKRIILADLEGLARHGSLPNIDPLERVWKGVVDL